MRLGAKLIGGFSLAALITLILGAVGYYSALSGARCADEIGVVRLPSVDSLLTIKAEAESIRGTLRTLAIPGLTPELRERQNKNLASSRERYEKAWKIYEPLPQTPEEAVTWQKFVPAWKEWRGLNNQYLELCKKIDANGISDPTELGRNLEQFTKDHYALVQRVLHIIYQGDKVFQGGDDHTACNAGKWLASFSANNKDLQEAIKAIAEPHQRFHQAVHKIKEQVNGGQSEQAAATYKAEMLPAMEGVFNGFHRMLASASNAIELHEEAEKLLLGPLVQKQRDTSVLLDKLVQINQDVAAQEVKDAGATSSFIKVLVIIASLVGVALAMLLGISITLSITRPINRVIQGLGEGSSQVASASGQVANASQSLAEGAAEQAAALEETTSSMEEMSSMTKTNADNAFQADTLMKEARTVVGRANESMTQLTVAMQEISKAGEETGKIIKTIDEIAFQTNLLALNAAVEAARAGEAGAGFAVVAEEVRNLAMRAAEAAKNTTGLIEGTIKKTQDGSELVRKTNEAFREVTESSTKVAELVSEIAAASSEQAQGIEQVNKAMGEMDKVTQQNAANAEESAAAAEELSAQAETMQGHVEQLIKVVGTAKNGNGHHRQVSGETAHHALPHKALPKPNAKSAHQRFAMAKKAEPSELFPLDDGDFKNF